MLRQAGFPVDLLDILIHDAGDHAAAVRDAHEAARGAAEILARVLRSSDAASNQRPLTRLGRLKQLAAADRRAVPDAQQDLVTAYHVALTGLGEALDQFDRRHARALETSRAQVKQLFQERTELRQVLMLSNEANYPHFDGWLTQDRDPSDRTGRRMTDLLTMYLQRVTTKNETASHFGPVSVARVGAAGAGISWREGPLRRMAYLSHWAAERLAATLGSDPRFRGGIRPRLLPLAFREGNRVDRYAFRTRTGMPDDWVFIVVGSSQLEPDAEWIWRHADGQRTISELHQQWRESSGRPTHELDAVIDKCSNDGWLITLPEIPVGTIDPLAVLRDFVTESEVHATDVAQILDDLTKFLHTFPDAPLPDRFELSRSIRERFEEFTGESAERPGGSHYADRSIFYEEALGPQYDLSVSESIGRFIEDELSPVYEMVLFKPRARMRRETEILHAWALEAFGASTHVPLHRFYQAFFSAEQRIHAACAEVDHQVAAIEAELRSALLAEADLEAHEIEVGRQRLESVLARHTGGPPALCSPDVMLAAEDAQALADGRFTAVVGDCHALRDPLTHSSLAPLLAAEYGGAAEEAQSRYEGLLDPDEVLVDLARAHLDKTGVQLAYPCPDVEVYGRSGKPRGQVLQPRQLYIAVTEDRLELRAEGLTGRLRLKAPFAGGPGIRHDPLAVFAFPRHFGGIGLNLDDLRHVPRIRCGRVVLRRESWRVPAAQLAAWSPLERPLSADAAAFLGAERLQRSLGLPDRCFVKIPGEPKPIYVDWRAPLLVRQLFRLAKSATGTLEFSEMLPGPGELWLDVAGHRHTSELRCTVYSRSAGVPSAL
ncbi:lantibiotic dehydratase [Streptomyces sp. NPDC057438]|uniref:lantibiotic dehydratase n=1 Tax=Streptomyces sp. NPDC057438 TaxID=3346133 RepID=UPI0036AECB76